MLTKELEVVFCEKFCLLDGRLVGKKKKNIDPLFSLSLCLSNPFDVLREGDCSLATQ